MSSIVGMTSVVHGGNKDQRLSYINKIIEDAKKNFSSVLVEALTVEKNSIGIAEVRDLIQKSNYTSLSAQHRFFVVHDAQKLTDQGQNALLKLYEEPHDDITYILELDSYHALLPTIISRAVLYDVSEGDGSYTLDSLVKVNDFPLPASLKAYTLPELFKLCEDYSKDKQVARQFLMYLMLLSSDSMRFAVGSQIKQQVAFSEFLLQAIEWLNDTNVNTRLLLENSVLGWWNLVKG